MPEIDIGEEGVWIHVSHDRPAIKVVHAPTAKRLLSEGGRIVPDPTRPVQEDQPPDEQEDQPPDEQEVDRSALRGVKDAKRVRRPSKGE